MTEGAGTIVAIVLKSDSKTLYYKQFTNNFNYNKYKDI